MGLECCWSRAGEIGAGEVSLCRMELLGVVDSWDRAAKSSSIWGSTVVGILDEQC